MKKKLMVIALALMTCLATFSMRISNPYENCIKAYDNCVEGGSPVSECDQALTDCLEKVLT